MKSISSIEFILDEKGKRIGVVIRNQEFEKIIQTLEDLKDLATVYDRTSKKFKAIPYDKIRKELFGNGTKK